MPPQTISITGLRAQYAAGLLRPADVVARALAHSNSNATANVYLAQEPAWSAAEADRLLPERMASQPLWGVPVSLKDCFDLGGFVTTYGSKALARAAESDSAVAAALRAAGAIITGKTHLHQLAYGITGENADFGECVQPGAPHLLTGGSSSGACASVLEGSAMAAIGTDTGGSIRVPAALCGLMGYRASITMGAGMWHGAGHLAESFDTLGWIYRYAADGPLLGAALFGLPVVEACRIETLRVGVPDAKFLYDCEPGVLAVLDEWMAVLQSQGASVERFEASMWADAMEIFAPIQASEAAALHAEPRNVFEPAIAERLRWGATLPEGAITELRRRMHGFQSRSEEQMARFDYVLLPNTPVSELRAGEDHAGARAQILRYTSPISLLGWPTVTLPNRRGGPQLVAKMDRDAELLALSAALGSGRELLPGSYTNEPERIGCEDSRLF